MTDEQPPDAEKKAETFIVTAPKLAELFRITRQGVANWKNMGAPGFIPGRPEQVDLAEFLPWIREYYANTDRIRLDQARASLAEEQQRKVALEVVRLENRIIDPEDFERFLTSLFTVLRSRLLSLPRKVSIEVSPENPKPAEATLERCVTAILEELAADATRSEVLAGARGRRPKRVAGAPASAEAHRVGVG